MNKLVIIALLAIPIVSLARGVTKGDDGMYWKEYSSIVNSTIMYQVDSITQSCFINFLRSGGATETSCKNLSRRPEWKKIITWLSDDD